MHLKLRILILIGLSEVILIKETDTIHRELSGPKEGPVPTRFFSVF